MWQLEYKYDGVEIGDLYPITDDGYQFSVKRNNVGEIIFSVSLRRLSDWCRQHNFDIQRVFTPIRSTLKVYDGDAPVVGGWLSATPPFSFGASPDAVVHFTFTGYMGLTAGAYLIPPYSYNSRFDIAARDAVLEVIERTNNAGRAWPISWGGADQLPVVQATLEAPKTLKDFLLERTDNETGTGNFDVYVNPDGQISLHQHYGLDVSETSVFSYPDKGSKYNIRELAFDYWDDFVSDIHLTGAGNGYETTSGLEGAAIWSVDRNQATIDNIGYWQLAVSESDVSIQATLDAKATGYIKDTDKPFSRPSLKLDGDKHKVYGREYGGDLWVGDTISVDVDSWVKPLLPIPTPYKMRIDEVYGVVDATGHLDVTLGMAADDEE